MTHERPLPGWKDKILFTPGPLTTSREIKQAMLRDLGSRDYEFIGVVREVRERLVRLAMGSPADHTAVIVQGSGTFALEAVVGSTMPPGGKLLVVVNGAYGRRVAAIGRRLGIDVVTIDYAEDTPPAPEDVEAALRDDPDISQVSMCSCETTSGIFNPVDEVGEVVAAAGRSYFLDAMSNFGAHPIDVEKARIDYLVSSSNKCIEGVPGFGFVVARRERLLACEGWARSVALDLLAQYRGLEENGQFRFTPPTHVILAFHRALEELEQEGGVAARAARYRRNYEVLVEGMRDLGFREYLKPEHQGHIITSFLYPEHPAWDFDAFYRMLGDEGQVIYPGKVGDADCFRIGSIGRIGESDVRTLLATIRSALRQLGLPTGE